MSKDLHQVAPIDDFSSTGSRVIVDIDGHEVAVFRIGDEYHALANFCPHQSGPLCQGELTDCINIGDDDWEWVLEREGQVIQCPWHFWQFDVTTGENVNDSRYRVPTYEAVVEDKIVYVRR